MGKDKHAPPKPKNPYGKFTAECRPRLKETRPELASDLKAMGVALAEEWGKISEERKQVMQADYDKEMDIWKPLWAEYKKTKQYKNFVEIKTDWLDKRAQKKLMKTMNKDAPKRPKSGYMIFAGEIREEVMAKVRAENLGLGDAGGIIAERWAALSEAKKADYGEQSQKWKEKFDVEFAAYKKGEAYGHFIEAKVKLETQQQLKKNVRVQLDDAPKKAPSPFALFRSEVMPNLVKQNSQAAEGEKLGMKDMAKKIGEMWAAVPEEKKAEYSKITEKAKVQYEKEY